MRPAVFRTEAIGVWDVGMACREPWLDWIDGVGDGNLPGNLPNSCVDVEEVIESGTMRYEDKSYCPVFKVHAHSERLLIDPMTSAPFAVRCEAELYHGAVRLLCRIQQSGSPSFNEHATSNI